jgi:hypothetical protein
LDYRLLVRDEGPSQPLGPSEEGLVSTMTTRPMAPGPPERGHGPPERRARPTVDAGQLWAGGAATAVVAGLIALVGVLVSRWLFNVPILAPKHDGAYGNVHTTTLILVSALAALVATLLAHLLLLSTPRPMLFFGWIVGLVTLVMVIFPFSTGATMEEKIATAAVYLVIGVAIGTLISGVAHRAVRRRRVVSAPPGGYPPQSYPGQTYQGQTNPGRDYPGRDY